jgi:X-Pro dipeptidyl-peptidase
MVHGLTDDNVKTMHFADLWREIEKCNMPRKIWLHRPTRSETPSSRSRAGWRT